jgi:CRISPR-associated endonuclease Csy4
MDSYIDIQLRPDPEFTPHQLLSGLYARLHRTLAQLGSQDIGVSFPGYASRESAPATPLAATPQTSRKSTAVSTLGNCLRLHGPASSLQRLTTTGWLQGMLDHVTVSAIGSVPSDTAHCRFARVQAKSSPARLRRRAMRRHGLDEPAAAQRIPDTAAEQLQLPFVIIGSRSTGQPSFPLFIRRDPAQPQAVSGNFNSYGLSQNATVPWF